MLAGLALPTPNAEGKYLASEIDALMADLYRRGAQCESNLNAVREIYEAATDG